MTKILRRLLLFIARGAPPPRTAAPALADSLSSRRPLALPIALALMACLAAPRAQNASRPPLAAGDVDAIAKILMLEDTRQLDTAVLGELLKSSHPEVRRRAIIAVGRIVKEGAGALLLPLRSEKDPTLLGAVVFATGQLREAASVPWLNDVMASTSVDPEVSREAARSLGKITAPESRAALAAYLTSAPTTIGTRAAVVGEALLSIGRFGKTEDVAPMLRWATSSDVEIRWRASWALFRCGSAAAVPQLMKFAKDDEPEVRFWSLRGLAPAAVDAAGVDRATVSTLLRAATRDADRRVRTEALRALGLYLDDDAYKVVLASLESSDTWIAVSAAEAIARYKDHADIIVPRLQAIITAPATPTAVRVTSLTSLTALSPDAAIDAAATVIKTTAGYARTAAVTALGGRGLAPAGRERLDALAADPATKDLVPVPGAGRGGGPGGGRPPQPVRTLDEYRAIVERWIVPDYNGAPKPRAILETPRGAIEIEFYAADAPLGMEHFVRVVTSGSIVGTLFTRVVPNFVDQQAGISDASTLRDEVNQRGLLRSTLSWASAGLDTGRPGYTLGNTPQPHNEGNFTALGHVVSGMDAVDHTELGDAITAARMVTVR